MAKRKVGRPGRPHSERTAQVVVCLTPKEKEAYRTHCFNVGSSMGQHLYALVRGTIANSMEQQEG